MSRCIQFFEIFILFLGIVLTDFAPLPLGHFELCHHSSYCTESFTQKASLRTLSLASSLSWYPNVVNSSTGIHQEHFAITPQQRSGSSSTHQRSNGSTDQGKCWLDVRQLQEAQEQKCLVLRPLWHSLGRLHSVPETKGAAIEIGIEKDVLDGTRPSALGRSLWRRPEPTATTKEESWPRQRENQGTQWTSPTDPCATATTANWPQWPTATLDEHAPSTRCSNFIGINNSVTGGTEVEGGLHIVEEGQLGNSDAGASAVCCGRDKGRIKEGCQDAVYCGGCPDKGTRGAGHCASCQKQPDDAMASLPDNVVGAVQTVYRPLPESGTGPSGEHQEREREASQGKRRLQLERGGSNSDLRRRRGGERHIDKGIGRKDLGRSCTYDGKPTETFRAGRERGRRGEKGQEAASERRRTTGCGNAVRRIAFNAAFWCARSLMTLEYFDRWAAWPPSSIAADVASLQWSHSILQERFYKSPWQASEDAMHLAFTMQPTSFIQQASSNNVRNENGVSPCLTEKSKRVSQSHLTQLPTSILDLNSAHHGLQAESPLMMFHNENGCRRAAHSRNPIARLLKPTQLHNNF